MKQATRKDAGPVFDQGWQIKVDLMGWGMVELAPGLGCL
jgi:hypothetical protein